MPIPKKDKKERPITAKERVYNGLRDWIMDFTLQPGEKLVDVEIAEYFSVSRTPVREAIQMLSDQKLVDVIPGRESRVSEIDYTSISQAYSLISDLQVKAVQFSFNKINNDIILKLEKLNKELIDAVTAEDAKRAMVIDIEFHDVLVELADNDFIKDFNNILIAHISRVEYKYFKMLNKKMSSVLIHEKIINAIKDNNLEETIEAVRSNWELSQDLLEIMSK